MEKIFLAISIKEKKTKIAVFQIDKNNDIFINEAIKAIDKSELKFIKTKLRYIENGWLDFSQIKHIDLNGLIHYKLNNRG